MALSHATHKVISLPMFRKDLGVSYLASTCSVFLCSCFVFGLGLVSLAVFLGVVQLDLRFAPRYLLRLVGGLVKPSKRLEFHTTS